MYMHFILQGMNLQICERERGISIRKIQDDLENDWFFPDHVNPARIYFLE